MIRVVGVQCVSAWVTTLGVLTYSILVLSAV